MSDEQGLTDADLANLERLSTRGEIISLSPAIALRIVAELRRFRALDAPKVSAGEAIVMEHLVSELERLRSDEWLERAVDEYARAMGWQFEGPRDELLGILRKHRDGGH